MEDRCPTCGRPIQSLPPAQWQAELRRRIEELRQQIYHLQNGERDVIATQSSAPSCTICEQAPPGKPENASGDVAQQVWQLQQRIAELERQLQAV